ncbi:alpha-L-fucosidase [Seonamhaeicola maritimus]|uniref:alpha-L-fucosidase n=1 Tax=Seonamhaeicola maritimus TaxID=2591822 RepID=A0A5C7GL82_9FLAO|nr:alpha-L-fucosidase [Seonamhaeicola maritimus]TXG39246.1 alpha-L-fucosidase [Seonamhaeicola maritimus]
MKPYIIVLFCLLIISCKSEKKDNNPIEEAPITYKANWESLKQHKTPEWFLDAKFGIYFHWGVYSHIGKGEWYSRQMYEVKDEGWGKDIRPYHLETYGKDVHYHEFIDKFTAEHFNATEWAKLFKASGAKYVGPVAEHCDNFSNWDSKINKYNTVNYGPKRDIVGELEKAIKAEDLKFVATFHHSWEWGWYNTWSGLIDTTAVGFEDFYGERTLPETFHSFKGGHDASGQFTGKVNPKYAPSKKFINSWKTKIYEVVDNYQPDLLWFDSRLFVLPEKDRQEMVAHYYNKGVEWNKPVVLTYKNNDLAKGVGVLDLEKGRFDEKTEFPWLTDDSYAWAGWSWRNDLRLKTPTIIIQELVDISSKNGCLLLNITPTGDGLIPEEMRIGLLEIGKWLDVNGEAVYATRPYLTYGEGSTKLKKNHFGGVQGDGVTYKSSDFRFTQNKSKDAIYITQLALPKPNELFVLKTFGNEGVGKNETIKSVELLGSDEIVEWNKTGQGLKIKAPKVLPNEHVLVYKVNIRV